MEKTLTPTDYELKLFLMNYFNELLDIFEDKSFTLYTLLSESGIDGLIVHMSSKYCTAKQSKDIDRFLEVYEIDDFIYHNRLDNHEYVKA